MPTSPKPPQGSIDFEVTDFDDARRSLDELPARVSEMNRLMRGHEWTSQRRKALPTGRALTGTAMDWVIGWPPVVRPHAACEQFPHVVNVIAESWSDVHCSLQVIDHMIRDCRGGRRGFPAAVKTELQALYDFQHRRQVP